MYLGTASHTLCFAGATPARCHDPQIRPSTLQPWQSGGSNTPDSRCIIINRPYFIYRVNFCCASLLNLAHMPDSFAVSPVNASLPFGGLLIGCFCSILLFGSTCVQAYCYALNNRDSKRFRFMVISSPHFKPSINPSLPVLQVFIIWFDSSDADAVVSELTSALTGCWRPLTPLSSCISCTLLQLIISAISQSSRPMPLSRSQASLRLLLVQSSR